MTKTIPTNGLWKQKQLGMTLLEVMMSLAIVSVALVGLTVIADKYSTDTKLTIAASQERAFGEATKAYIKDNYAAIQTIATTTTPALIDVATLIAAGNLQAGFLTTNAYGQAMCALVLEPTANRLQAMVVSEGGDVIDDFSLGSLAAMIGGSGGGVYASAPTIIRGAIGGWSIPTATFHNLTNNVNRHCDGTTGPVQVVAGRPVMSLWFENGDTSSAFLSRDVVPGRPELNAMNTPMVMNSVQTVGGACTTTGAIARDGGGAIVSCQSGLWKAASAGDTKCVATAADLNTLQDDGRCFNGVGNANSPAGGDWFFLEVSRHINPANFYTTQRVTGMINSSAGKVWQRNQQSGTSAVGWGAWVQIADPNVGIASGNVTAAGRVTANGTGLIGGANQTAYDVAGGRIAAGQAIYSYDKICAGNSSGTCNGTGGAILSANGDITANGQISVGANNRILGNGAQGSYGATTVAGDKNGWTGLEFRDASGNYQVNQMTNRSNIGYYDAAGGRWLNYTDTAGNHTLDQTGDMSSGRLNPGWAVETWGCSTGQIAKAAYTVGDGWAYNGKPLSCVNGVWMNNGGVSAGTLCGAATANSVWRDGYYTACMGNHPRYSCPWSYTQVITGEADGVYFYSCVKN